MISRSVKLVMWRFPNYWEEVIERFWSGSALIQKVTQMAGETFLDDAQGVSYFLRDDLGGEMQLMIAEDCWAIAFSAGNNPPIVTWADDEEKTGTVSILIPEWTAVDARHFISAASAEEVVKTWVETGDLSDAVEWR